MKDNFFIKNEIKQDELYKVKTWGREERDKKIKKIWKQKLGKEELGGVWELWSTPIG